jgi:hypothetical protein
MDSEVFINLLVVSLTIAYTILESIKGIDSNRIYGANMLKKNPFQRVKPTLFETEELSNKGLEPQNYTTVECLCLGMQVVNSVTVKNNVTNTNDPMLAVVVQVAIPVDPKSMQNALITPDGLSNKFTEACPIAPTIRLPIHNEYIVDSLKVEPKPSDTKTDDGAKKETLDDVLKRMGL